MIDLRFVERSVEDVVLSVVIGEPPILRMKKIRVLQCRQPTNLIEVSCLCYEPIWGEWEDVRMESEEQSSDG